MLSFVVNASDAVSALVHKGGHPLLLLPQSAYCHPCAGLLLAGVIRLLLDDFRPQYFTVLVDCLHYLSTVLLIVCIVWSCLKTGPAVLHGRMRLSATCVNIKGLIYFSAIKVF